MAHGRVILLAGGLSIFVGALATQTPAPTGKTAEQQFKNIQSFKGKPADTVLPAMQFMSASLGVSCDYCHVENDFASDSKEEKKTARSMITMQNDINTKNFEGKTRVTCATCHGGHTNPNPRPPIPGSALFVKRAPDAKPDDTLAAYQTSLGSSSDISALTTLHLQGTKTMKDTATPVDLYISGSTQAIVITHMTGTDMSVGYDGKVAWHSTLQGSQILPSQYNDLVMRGLAVYWNSSFLPKLDKPSVATTQIDGKDYMVVRGATPDGTESFIFDKETGLLRRIVHSTVTILGSLPDVYDYTDYQKVNGVMIPFTITQNTNQGVAVQKFTKADTAAPPAGFSPPAK
jgi:hypothetical protein